MSLFCFISLVAVIVILSKAKNLSVFSQKTAILFAGANFVRPQQPPNNGQQQITTAVFKSLKYLPQKIFTPKPKATLASGLFLCLFSFYHILPYGCSPCGRLFVHLAYVTFLFPIYSVITGLKKFSYRTTLFVECIMLLITMSPISLSPPRTNALIMLSLLFT